MKQSTRTSSRKGQKKRIYNCAIWKSRKQNSEMRKSRSRGNVERNFTRASALGEISLRPGESEIVWEIFVQCAKILSLRTEALSSPEKQCHDPPLYGKILGCQREGKKKKENRSKAAGKQAQTSDAALQRRTSSPRARKGSDDRDTKKLPNIPFHTGKGGSRWGVYGTQL